MMLNFSENDGPSGLAGRGAILLVGLAIAGTVLALYGPSLSFPLTGDSYQWIQHAHLAAHRPALFVADLDTFYRPSTTWSLAADRILWGGFNAPGYRTSSLALHGLVGLLLTIVGRRLGLGWCASAALGLVWVTSPFSDESALVVAYRFQPLLLLSWFVLIVVWPRETESWGAVRLGVAVLSVFAAAASKETWVVTPALAAALEFERRRSLKDAVVAGFAVGSAVAAYLAFYFVAFPGSKSYFEPGPHILARIPSQLAVFFYLDQPPPDGFSLSWKAVVAAFAVVAVIAMCVKWRVQGTFVAVGLLVLPTLPTILVPYMPQRYLAIPYAGFLLLIGFWVHALKMRYPERQRSVRVVAVAGLVFVIAAGVTTVRADIEDYRTISAAHGVLLDEAREVAATVAGGAPVVVVRDENSYPLLDVVDAPTGYPKLIYIRNHDPYGLVDTAALFEWVLADEGTRVEHISDRRSIFDDTEGAILVHVDGGFVHLGTTRDLEFEVNRWAEAGFSVRLIKATMLS